MLRPGKHFVRLIGILAALALLVTVFVPLVWAIVAALAVLVLLAAAESVLLLRVRFTGERPAKSSRCRWRSARRPRGRCG